MSGWRIYPDRDEDGPCWIASNGDDWVMTFSTREQAEAFLAERTAGENGQ